MKTDLAKLQRILGHQFRDVRLLTEAMMHRSFAAENNLKFDNQRQEFLGDAVLQIILTDYVFRKYPEFAEGLLTKIRSSMADELSFARLARKISLGEFIMLGKGEIENNGAERNSILADAFEAVMGAIYLDSDLETVRGIFLKLIEETYPDPAALLESNNPKGMLQEYCQHRFGVSPFYTTLSVTGEDHDPVFNIQVSIGNTVLAVSSAKKRKIAEGLAAMDALNLLRSNKITVDLPELSKGKESE